MFKVVAFENCVESASARRNLAGAPVCVFRVVVSACNEFVAEGEKKGVKWSCDMA
jgi:hypothetical protein